MANKHGKRTRRPAGRSLAQQQGSAAVMKVMRAWENLTDMERLAWRTYGKTQRRRGINCFKSVNLLRLRRGEELGPAAALAQALRRQHRCSRNWKSTTMPGRSP